MKKNLWFLLLLSLMVLISGCANPNNEIVENIEAVENPDVSVVFDQDICVYDGQIQNPGITVKLGEVILTQGADYEIQDFNWKNVGTHTVRVNLKNNYSGYSTAQFNVIPEKTNISEVIGTEAGFSVSWEGITEQITGYEIQYSRYSDFSKAETVIVDDSATTSYAVDGLIKGDRYYVRVRTYAVVGDKVYYSVYSPASFVCAASEQPTYDITEEQILRDGEWKQFAADDTECMMIEHVSKVIPTAQNRRYYLNDSGIWTNGQDSSEDAVIMFTGDLLCQTRQQEAVKDEDGQYDFSESFKLVEEVFDEADLVVGNLEVSMCDQASYMAEEIEVATSPHVNAPSAWLNALDYAGYDVLTIANNHNLDVGALGIFTTLRHINDYGFISTGLFDSESTPRFKITETNGIKIGHIAYGVFYNNKEHYLTESAQGMMINKYSEERAKEDIAAAKEAGAEFVVVYMHWGRQYQHEPPENSYSRAQELANAGADYIIGSHPHVVSPYGYVTSDDGRQVPVWYSLGNFISHQLHLGTKSTLIVQLTLRKEDGKVVIVDEGYIPCKTFETIKGEHYVEVPLTSPYSAGYENKYFPASYNSTVKNIGPRVKVLGEFVYNGE